MKTSSNDEVRKMYDETVESYDKMMDVEIGLSVYSDTLERLRDRIVKTTGTLIDTACGSGHMLAMYHEQYDYRRSLLGVDLSPRMVAIAARRLGNSARIVVGDMCDLSEVATSPLRQDICHGFVGKANVKKLLQIVYDKSLAKIAQDSAFPVFLCKTDGTFFHLSLNFYNMIFKSFLKMCGKSIEIQQH